LAGLPKNRDANLLVGFETGDDAAVYAINRDTAIVQTVDFFPPMVDDPYSFGQIAAANALSDVYAMGGTPCLALNLLAFPSCLPLEVVEAILQGGAAKIMEAGAVVAGGHSIEDEEPKYGLCVTGLVRPEEILTNTGIQEGDLLILTKPLGTGILNTAAKAELLTAKENMALVQVMATLNKYAAQAAKPFAVHACTDVTGFGLLEHAVEMTGKGKHTVEIWAEQVPVLPKALELARMGLIPAGAYRNRDYVKDKIGIVGDQKRELLDILYDPQTSGGLLLSVGPREAKQLLQALQDTGSCGVVLGCVKAREDRAVVVK